MIKKIIFSICLTAAFTVSAQTVTTYAGIKYIGNGGFTGVGTNPLLSEEYSIPGGICLDTNNRFYVADMHNIYVLTNGNSYTRGGYLGDPNGPDGVGQSNQSGTVSRFQFPCGVFVHPKTNEVYICDRDNGIIRKGNAYVNSSNVHLWSTHAGIYSFIGGYTDGSTTIAKFSSPEDIVIPSDGTIYIADYGNDCIRKISGDSVSTFVGKGLTPGDVDSTYQSARFNVPSGMCLMDDNNILVADRNNKKVKKINLSTGAVTTVVSGLKTPADVVYVDGAIYITDGSCVKRWDGTTVTVYAGNETNSGYVNASGSSARFGELGLMVYNDNDKSIYICDRENNVIRRLTVIQPPVADFVADKTAVSTNEVVTVTSKSTFANTYLWTITPGNYTLQNKSTLTDSIIFVTFNSTGSYTLSLKATNKTGNNTKTKPNYINVSFISTNAPTPDFIADNTMPIVNETVTLIDQSGNNPQQWEWTIAPSAGVSYMNSTTYTSRFPDVEFSQTGTYAVTLKSTNTNGSNSKLRTNYINVSLTGIEKLNDVNRLELYPNPATGFVFIPALQYNPNAIARFVDISGKTNTLAAINGKVNINVLAAGFYTVSIEENGKLYLSKLIVLH